MTNILFKEHPELYGAIMIHGAAVLPKLRVMTQVQRANIMTETNRINLSTPLHEAGPSRQFNVPTWGCDAITGAQVIALMVFSLWVECGEDENKSRPLVQSWPIKEAMLLCREQAPR